MTRYANAQVPKLQKRENKEVSALLILRQKSDNESHVLGGVALVLRGTN
jgi:hypothetical protein